MHFSWYGVPYRSPEAEKAIDNAVKDYRKQQQTCVLVKGGHFEHLMW